MKMIGLAHAGGRHLAAWTRWRRETKNIFELPMAFSSPTTARNLSTPTGPRRYPKSRLRGREPPNSSVTYEYNANITPKLCIFR